MVEALKSEGVTEIGSDWILFRRYIQISLITWTNDITLFIWLGRCLFDLAFENVIKVSVVSHPSLLKVPDDLEVRSVLFSSISLFTLHHSVLCRSSILSLKTLEIFQCHHFKKVPLLINSCTVDQQFPLEAFAKGDEIFGGFAQGYKREYFQSWRVHAKVCCSWRFEWS